MDYVFSFDKVPAFNYTFNNAFNFKNEYNTDLIFALQGSSNYDSA